MAGDLLGDDGNSNNDNEWQWPELPSLSEIKADAKNGAIWILGGYVSCLEWFIDKLEEYQGPKVTQGADGKLYVGDPKDNHPIIPLEEFSKKSG